MQQQYQPESEEKSSKLTMLGPCNSQTFSEPWHHQQTSTKQGTHLPQENLSPNQQQNSCYDPKICHSCDTVITDFYIMKERCWHERCLKCCMCGKSMQVTCQEREGRFYCSEDYYRLFGDRCFVCRELIANMDMVIKLQTGNYCHTTCFRCVTCQRQLNTGDLYSINTEYGWLYCQDHTREPASSHQNHQQHQHLHLLRQGELNMASMASDGTIYWSDDCLDDLNGKSDKRPRTVLSSCQRRVLKAAFDMDPKPSKKARHVMAVETGLTNRVVQVWFQNQRAKMKKRIKFAPASTDEGSDSDPNAAAKKTNIYDNTGDSSNEENQSASQEDECDSTGIGNNTTDLNMETLFHLDESGENLSSAVYKSFQHINTSNNATIYTQTTSSIH